MSTGVLWTMAALALTTSACGSDVGPASSPATGSEWSTYHDQARGYEVGVPNGWQRASGSVTPNITSPREILTLATVRPDGVSPENYCRPWDEAQLPEFSERDALVTIQEAGAGRSGSTTRATRRARSASGPSSLRAVRGSPPASSATYR